MNGVIALARLMMPLIAEEIAVVRYSASIGDALARQWSTPPARGSLRARCTQLAEFTKGKVTTGG